MIDGEMTTGLQRHSRALNAISEFLTRDRLPALNRYWNWFRQPIGWFSLAGVLAALVGAFAAPQGWYVFAIVAAIVATGTLWPWLALKGIAVELRFDQRRCREGEVVGVELTVTNRWPWPVWGILLQDSSGALAGASATAPAIGSAGERDFSALAGVSGCSRTRFHLPYLPRRRGMYPAAKLAVTTGFPFGFWFPMREIVVVNQLIVHPRMLAIGFPELPRSGRMATEGVLVDRPGPDGDPIDTRSYRPGDPLRQINWALTARRDSLIVNQRQAVSRQQVVVALNALETLPSLPDRQAFEDWMVRVAASLCGRLLRRESDVTLALGGEYYKIPPSRAGLTKLLDMLATCQPTAVGSNGHSRTGPKVAGAVTVHISADHARAHTQGARGRPRHLQRTILVTDESGNGAAAPPLGEQNDPSARPWLQLDVGELSRCTAVATGNVAPAWAHRHSCIPAEEVEA